MALRLKGMDEDNGLGKDPSIMTSSVSFSMLDGHLGAGRGGAH